MPNSVKRLRIVWMCLLTGLVIVLLWLAIVPFGSITYSTDFLSRDYFIGPLTPKERLAGEERRAARTITGEPVYFSLFTPRPFRKATVTIEYDKPVPMLEVGVRRDGVVWNYERRPIQIAALDRIANDSKTLRDGELMLWQRTTQYKSIKDFLAKPPSPNEIATYNYSLNAPFVIEDYAPLSELHRLLLGARGNYIMNIYSGGEPINIEFTVHDLNINKDADDIAVTLYSREGPVIAEAQLADDQGRPDVTSAERKFSLRTGPLKAGSYRLEFKANDDIITDELMTRQSKLAFVNRLWLAGTERSNLELVTDAASLTAQTIAAGSKQAISFDGKPLELSETYTQFKADATDAARRARTIRLERDDVILAADGAFALSADQLFNPAPRQITDDMDATALGADYVIARYEPAIETKRSVTFSLDTAYREKNMYSFMIAAPGVSEVPDGLEITSITMKLEGETLFGYLKKLVSRL